MANKNNPQALAQAFLKKKTTLNNFQGVKQGPLNSFRTLFEIGELNAMEEEAIRALMLDNELSSAEVAQDFLDLKTVTAEIKSINKQGILLIGERIDKAKDILQKYGDGKAPFSTWIDTTFGSRKSAYNMLAYFLFHADLPDEYSKSKLKELPLQAAYILASREGSVQKKQEILHNYRGEKQKELVVKIQEALPLAQTDKRKKKSPSIEALLLSLEMVAQSLCEHELTPKQQQRLHKIIHLLEKNAFDHTCP